MGGRVVQLQQGERLALASDDLDGWIEKFSGVPDRPAHRSRRGDGPAGQRRAGPPRRRAAALSGRRRRAVDRTRAGTARRRRAPRHPRVVALQRSRRQPRARRGVRRSRSIPTCSSAPSTAAAARSSSTAGRRRSPITPEDAARALEPFVGAFLYTHVDTEGMLTGLNLDAVKSVQAATGGGSSPPAASRAARRSIRSTRSASTPSWGWRSIRGRSR